jgi:hypothetical protein
MTLESIWEVAKTPARQVLLFAYAFIINKLFELAFTYLGFEFTPEQKVQILGYGTPIVWFLLSLVDRKLHLIGKAKEGTTTKKLAVVSKLTTGLTGF